MLRQEMSRLLESKSAEGLTAGSSHGVDARGELVRAEEGCLSRSCQELASGWFWPHAESVLAV